MFINSLFPCYLGIISISHTSQMNDYYSALQFLYCEYIVFGKKYKHAFNYISFGNYSPLYCYSFTVLQSIWTHFGLVPGYVYNDNPVYLRKNGSKMDV